jgi:hypothetical protein
MNGERYLRLKGRNRLHIATLDVAALKVELSQSHDEKGGEIQGLTVEMIQLHTTGLEVKILQCHAMM